MSRLHAFVCGKVQGVSYRDFVCQAASKLKLNGWVKNLKNGTVEVAAEGSTIVLMGLAEVLKKGPPKSEVKRVDIKWETELKEDEGFKTRR
jgi:acylphosphatase